MHLLHKGRLSINNATFPQHPVNLPNDDIRLYDVLKNRLNPNTIINPVPKWQIMRITDHVRAIRCININSVNLDARTVPKSIRPRPFLPRPDNEYF